MENVKEKIDTISNADGAVEIRDYVDYFNNFHKSKDDIFWLYL